MSEPISRRGTWKSLLARILVFIVLPGLAAFGLLDWLESQGLKTARDRVREEMGEILSRLEIQGHPRTFFEQTLTRLIRLPRPLIEIRKSLEGLVRDSGEALELHLFDGAGKWQRGLGTAKPSRSAAEIFLRHLLRPGESEPSPVVAAFAGNSRAAFLMSQVPDSLLELYNGQRKSFGGYWTVPGKNGRPRGYVLAFLHSGALVREEFFQAAVQRIATLVYETYRIGWYRPSEPGRVYPTTSEWPDDLQRVLTDLPHGISDFVAGGRIGRLQVAADGTVLFALARMEVDLPSVRSLRRGLLMGLGMAILVFVLLAGTRLADRIGFAGRFTLLLMAGGGIPMTVLLLTSVIDRFDREKILVEEIQNDQVEELLKLDRRYKSSLNRTFKQYRDFSRSMRTMPDEHIPARLRAFFGKRLNAVGGFLQSVLAIDWRGQVVLDQTVAGSIIARTGKSTSLPKIAMGLLRKKRVKAGVVDSSPEKLGDTVSSAFLHDFDSDLAVYHSFGLTFLMFIDVCGYPAPTHLFLAFHDPRVAQTSFLQRFDRRWNRNARSGPLFLAVPRINREGLRPILPGRRVSMQSLEKLGKQADSTMLPQHRRLILKQREFLVTALPGQGLDNFILFLAYPVEEIQRQVRWLDFQLTSLALAIFSLITLVGWFASKAFLRPLTALTGGLQALDRREFDHRLPAERWETDEMMRVGERFNQIMQTLEELQLARTVQEQLWPDRGMTGSGWEIHGACQTAADLGGDFLDWFPLDDGRVLIGVGDVAGHGIGASLVAASAKSELFFSVREPRSPMAILERMNQGFLRNAGRMKPMTFWVGLFDPVQRELSYASAGNPYPVFMPSPESSSMQGVPAYPLGARKKLTGTDQTIDLRGGGRLFLYSDGLVEELNPQGEQLGYDRLMAILARSWAFSPAASIAFVQQEVLRWSGRKTPNDDMTLVVLSVSSAAIAPEVF